MSEVVGVYTSSDEVLVEVSGVIVHRKPIRTEWPEEFSVPDAEVMDEVARQHRNNQHTLFETNREAVVRFFNGEINPPHRSFEMHASFQKLVALRGKIDLHFRGKSHKSTTHGGVMKQYLIAEDTPSMSFEDLAHAGLLSPGPTHAVIHCRVRDLHHSIYAYVSPDGSGFLQASNVPCQELVPWRNARGVITGLTCYGKWPERHRASKLYFVPSRGDFVCKSCGNVRYECQFVGRTIRRVPVEVLHHQYDGGGGLQPTKVNVSKDGSTTIEVWRSGWTFSVQS